MTNREFFVIAIYILLCAMVFLFIGIKIGGRIEKIQNNNKKEVINNEQPYYPKPDSFAIYPDSGIIIIDLPDEIDIIVKQEGCK